MQPTGVRILPFRFPHWRQVACISGSFSAQEGRIMGGRIIQTAALLPRFSPMILPTMILPTEFALGVVGDP
jgi:hypothetical protein